MTELLKILNKNSNSFSESTNFVFNNRDYLGLSIEPNLRILILEKI